MCSYVYYVLLMKIISCWVFAYHGVLDIVNNRHMNIFICIFTEVILITKYIIHVYLAGICGYSVQLRNILFFYLMFCIKHQHLTKCCKCLPLGNEDLRRLEIHCIYFKRLSINQNILYIGTGNWAGFQQSAPFQMNKSYTYL